MAKFLKVGTKTSYLAIEEKDNNVLYWCSDTREIYKGSTLYTEPCRIVGSRPVTPAVGVLYIEASGIVEMYDGTKWNTVALPYMTSGTVSTTSTYDQVPTAKVVYDSIIDAIAGSGSTDTFVNNIVSTTAGTITVTKGDSTTSEVALKGVIINPSYNSSTRTITLPYADGTQSLEISLGKDIFIDTNADNKYNKETGNIELYLNDGTTTDPTKIEIPAASLVDVYTGKVTTTTNTAVSENNEISVDVKLSTDSKNDIVIDETGLLVDGSKYATASDLQSLQDTVTANETDIEQKFLNVKTDVDILNGDENTEGSVAHAVKAVSDNLSSLSTTVQGMNNTDTGILAQAKTYTDTTVSWNTF